VSKTGKDGKDANLRGSRVFDASEPDKSMG
jgi:hypothetical protein